MNVSNIDLSNATDTDLRILGNKLNETKQITITVQPNYQEQVVQLTKDVEYLSIGKGNNSKQSLSQFLTSNIHIQNSQQPHQSSNSHCFVCLELSDDIKLTSCCNQFIHQDCYNKSVDTGLKRTKPKREIVNMKNLTKEEKQKNEQLRQEVGKLCPHCRTKVPVLEDICINKLPLLHNQFARDNQSQFSKMLMAIQNRVAECERDAMQQKVVLYLDQFDDCHDISAPSISVHADDINSREATDTYFDMLYCSELDTEQLDDAQTFSLKTAAATEKALKEKVVQYQQALLSQRIDNHDTIRNLQIQLRQGEIEKEVDLAEKLEAMSMKEHSKGIQIKTAVTAFKQHKQQLVTTESWLQSLKYCKADGINDQFKKVGEPICDAIIFPKCPLLFKEKKQDFKKMQNFLTQMGLPVRIVCSAPRNGCVFVQLEDGRNIFTLELLAKIRAAISVLTLRTYRVLRKQGLAHDDEQILAQMLRLYIRQIDFTQDISGSIIFSLSLETPCTDLFNAIRELGAIIGMPYSNDYNQLLTCIQYLGCDKNRQTQERMKIYNKLVHLLTCGQFKKTLNTAVDKLLYPSLSFYQNKIKPTLDTGLSRIEYSAYFNSYEDYNLRFLLRDTYLKRVDDALAALNQLKHKFYYKISLELMLNSYFTFCKTQLVAFDGNVQIIAYSYNSRSYTFAGVVNNKTRHSPSNLVFLKKYIALNGNASIFLQGQLLGQITKIGSEMQIPIHSFNSTHKQKLVEFQQENLLFNIKNTSKIQINTGDRAVADFLRISCQHLGYMEDQEMDAYIAAEINNEVERGHIQFEINQDELNDIDSLKFQINTDQSEAKMMKKQAATILHKRSAPAVCTCIGKVCITDHDFIHTIKCEWQQMQTKSGGVVKGNKREQKEKKKHMDSKQTPVKLSNRAYAKIVVEEEWKYISIDKRGAKIYKCLKCEIHTCRRDNRKTHDCEQ